MQMKHRTFLRVHMLALLLATLACTVVAHADEAGDRPITTLELASDARFSDGKVELMQGVADAVGYRFELPKTDLMEPIAVDVYTRGSPAGAVRLRVGKGDWANPARDGKTDASGRVGFRFRTYDGVKFWVTADEPTPYQIIVWKGAPIVLQPPPMAMPMRVFVQKHPEAAPSASASISGARIAIGASIALLLAIAAVMLFKRNKSKGANA